MAFEEYWNSCREQGKPDFDNWLEKYLDELKRCKSKILDMGCGMGNDSLYLSENGLKTIACDYSTLAIENVKKYKLASEVLLLDISKTLPFEENSFDCVIADLSLHYFDEETTKKIMLELKRILSQNGFLFARVNSVNDKNFGAGNGVLLENNYYFVNGYNKRFFDSEDIYKYFSLIGDLTFFETRMFRYGKEKVVYEVKVQKNSNNV